MDELAEPVTTVDAAIQTEQDDLVPRGVVIKAAAKVQAGRVNAGWPMCMGVELRAERRAWRRAFRKRPRNGRGRDQPDVPLGVRPWRADAEVRAVEECIERLSQLAFPLEEGAHDLPNDLEDWHGSRSGSQAEESSVNDDFRAEPAGNATPTPAIPPGFGRGGEGPSDLPPGFGG